MEKISGLILDIYDDPSGEVLKSTFPTAKDLPEIVKHAHALTQEERNNLSDEDFALILSQDGMEFKKFATIDSGNTALSTIYFLKTAYKLPSEAQRTAANNLCWACGNFGIEIPEELSKIASGEIVATSSKYISYPNTSDTISGQKTAFITAALMAPGAFREAKKNLQVAQAAGGQVITPAQINAQKIQMGLS